MSKKKSTTVKLGEATKKVNELKRELERITSLKKNRETNLTTLGVLILGVNDYNGLGGYTDVVTQCLLKIKELQLKQKKDGTDNPAIIQTLKEENERLWHLVRVSSNDPTLTTMISNENKDRGIKSEVIPPTPFFDGRPHRRDVDY